MLRSGFMAFAVLLVLLPFAFADTLYLKNGSKFEGKVVSETDKVVVFKIRGIGPQTFPRSKILKIELGSSIFDEFEAKKGALAADDLEGRFALANWCMENRLRREARQLYRAVLEADPEHVGARRALGYTKIGDEWLTPVEARRHREKRRKELEKVLGGLELGGPQANREEGVSFRPPKGWRRDEDSILATVYLGPEEHGIRILVGYETAQPASLASMKETVQQELKAAHDDLTPVRADAPAPLGRAVAKENVYTWASDESRVERHDVFLSREDDVLHVWFVFPFEASDALTGFFREVCASFMKPGEDLGDRPFAYKLPDRDWLEGFGLGQLDDAGVQWPDLPPDTEAIHHQTNPVFVLMSRAEATGADMLMSSLKEMRDGTKRFSTEPEKDRKVAGLEAKVIRFEGAFATDAGFDATFEGYACHFTRGKYGYLIELVSLLGVMDDRYLRADFGKLLDSFKVP